MMSADELELILERIASGTQTATDVEALRVILTDRSQDLLQLGKYNVNISQGQDIHIGDRVYVELDDRAIQAIVQAIQEKSAEAQKSGSISLHSQPGDRLKRLEELQRESRKQCIKHFRITVSNKEDAVSLADDLSIGIPPSNLQLPPGKVILLVGQLGIGKTLIAQRLFQQAIQRAIEDLDAPIPMYLELGKSEQVIPLQKSLENATNGLGNPETQGAVVILDGLDEVDSRLANEILIEADNLIEEWEKTTVIITSRSSRHTDEIKEKIEVPPLSDDQAYALIERLTKRQINAMICSNWTEGIRDAIHRPLFALILAGYLQSDSAKAPRSTGELLSWMVHDALEKAQAEYSNCDQLLKQLAILSIECGGSVVRSADVAITPDAPRNPEISRL